MISRFLQALVGLFELPQDESIPKDERFIEIEETPGYQNSYSKLIFASKKDYDPLQVNLIFKNPVIFELMRLNFQLNQQKITNFVKLISRKKFVYIITGNSRSQNKSCTKLIQIICWQSWNNPSIGQPN